MGRKSAVLARSRKAPPPEPPEEIDELDASDAEDSPSDELAGDDVPVDTLETEAIATDNVGEQSIEINVESLIAELEAETHKGRKPSVQCARRKLDDYLERKRIAQELEDFEDFEV